MTFLTQTSLNDGPGIHPAAAARSTAPRKRHPARGAAALFLIAPLLAILAACSTQSELRFANLMSEVKPTRAVILPPAGGPSVVAVLERKYQNGVSQEISLSTASATPGQNAIYVSMVNDLETLSEIDDTLRVRRITPDVVQKEMDDRLSGVEMRTSLFYAQNKYGPFGFATGRSSVGDLCLYAWQQIEPTKPAILTPGGAVSVRLRLCDAEATEEQLLRTMYGYTITAFFSSSDWNPFGDPPPVSPSLGELDAPINPLASGQFGSTPPVRTTPAPVRRAAPRRAVLKDVEAPPPLAPAIRQEPLSGYPVVPPPP
ncbi:cellulose biosynthesis protein BcsN [Microvirga antarctica]|uniref:cellulose biosynthesis protein BcsN n=1 Tax=Microvirga antarctica TaxID=2819233 RepID=UPI001B312782|nr:cellulose biosynthesis protein BcsN [Microvirga antarctica]